MSVGAPGALAGGCAHSPDQPVGAILLERGITIAQGCSKLEQTIDALLADPAFMPGNRLLGGDPQTGAPNLQPLAQRIVIVLSLDDALISNLRSPPAASARCRR
jgi:hypothetical protein